MKFTLQCPAKINLFLSVGKPDASGYHPIRSIFQAVSLFDEITIESASEDTFVCDSPDVPAENTVTKALRLVREVREVPPLRITLVKRIPSQSGLGGGSSDAAGLLRLIPRIAGELPWGHEQMVAEAVGADVPFFLVGGRARAEGYGERLTELPDGPVAHYVIHWPSCGVSTAAAYRALDAQDRPWRDYPDDDAPFFNDFEAIAPEPCHAAIARLKELGASRAALSGSGSAVFGELDSSESAANVAQEFGPNTWAVRSLGRQESLWTY